MKAARTGGVLAALKMGIFEVLHERIVELFPWQQRVARLRVMGSNGWYESVRDWRARTTLRFYTYAIFDE